MHREDVADGAIAAPERTGELLSTVKFMGQTLAAAGELPRDLQHELTYDGLRAAKAKGNKGGRRPAIPADETGAVRTAYLEGSSIAALARATVSAAEPSAPPSQTSCPSTRPPTRAPQPLSCRSSSTCQARWPTSSAPPSWRPQRALRSTKA